MPFARTISFFCYSAAPCAPERYATAQRVPYADFMAFLSAVSIRHACPRDLRAWDWLSHLRPGVNVIQHHDSALEHLNPPVTARALTLIATVLA